jgi:hypothetical protein
LDAQDPRFIEPRAQIGHNPITGEVEAALAGEARTVSSRISVSNRYRIVISGRLLSTDF